MLKEVFTIFSLVALVAAIGFTLQEENNTPFPTGDMIHHCIDDTECGSMGYCLNVNGGDGGSDGRRGKECHARLPPGMGCFDDNNCRTNHCDQTIHKCV